MPSFYVAKSLRYAQIVTFFYTDRKRREGAAACGGSPSDAFFVTSLADYPIMTNFPRKASRPPQLALEYEEARFAYA